MIEREREREKDNHIPIASIFLSAALVLPTASYHDVVRCVGGGVSSRTSIQQLRRSPLQSLSMTMLAEQH